MNITIRKINQRHIKDIYKLWKHTGLKVEKFKEEKKYIQRIIYHNPDTCLVAETRNQIIASVLGSFMGDKGWISRLSVHPLWQKKGIGSQLLKVVAQKLKRKGALSIHLSVAKSNEDVIGFYEKHGFKVRDSILLEQK